MGQVTQVSNEIASGAKEIKSFSNESGEENRFERANDENLKQNLKMESTGNITTPLIQIFVAFALAAMSYLSSYKFRRAKSSFRIICCFLYCSRLNGKAH